MRRGPGGGLMGGKAALIKQQQLKQQYEDKGSEIQNVKLSEALKICQEFQSQLTDFARKHREKINKDPKFRNAFHEMCLATGVDPLQSSRNTKKSGFWGNSGDDSVTFYSDLGVQILTQCIITRQLNGGLLHIKELVKRLKKTRQRPIISSKINSETSKHKNILVVEKQEHISEEDCIRAVDMLTKSLGPGVSIKKLGGGGTSMPPVRVISSVPEELDIDQNLALGHSVKNNGFVTVSLLKNEFGWEIERAERVCIFLVREGLCWIDKVENQEDSYWFPSIALGGNSI